MSDRLTFLVALSIVVVTIAIGIAVVVAWRQRPEIRRIATVVALAYVTVLVGALVASAIGPPLAGVALLLVPLGIAAWAIVRLRTNPSPIESITPVGRTWFWILIAAATLLLLASRLVMGR